MNSRYFLLSFLLFIGWFFTVPVNALIPFSDIQITTQPSASAFPNVNFTVTRTNSSIHPGNCEIALVLKRADLTTVKVCTPSDSGGWFSPTYNSTFNFNYNFTSLITGQFGGYRLYISLSDFSTSPTTYSNCYWDFTYGNGSSTSSSVYLYANPQTITVPQGTVLSWGATGCQNVTSNNFGISTLTGSKTVYPTSSTTYYLQVLDNNGAYQQAQVTVTVNSGTTGWWPDTWFWGTLTNIISGVATTVSNAITTSIGVLQTSIISALNSILGFIQAIASNVTLILSEITQGFADTISAITSGLFTLGNTLHGYLQTLSSDITTGLTAINSSIGQVGQSVLVEIINIKNSIANLPATITSGFSSLTSFLTTQAQNIIDKLGDVIAAIQLKISELSTKVDTVSDQFKTWANAQRVSLTTDITAIIASANTILHDIVNAVCDVTARLIQLGIDITSKIIDLGVNIGTWFTQIISHMGSAAVQDFSSLISAINILSGKLSTFADTVGSSITSAMDNIGLALSGIASTISGIISNITSAVTSLITGIGQKLWELRDFIWEKILLFEQFCLDRYQVFIDWLVSVKNWFVDNFLTDIKHFLDVTQSVASGIWRIVEFVWTDVLSGDLLAKIGNWIKSIVIGSDDPFQRLNTLKETVLEWGPLHVITTIVGIFANVQTNRELITPLQVTINDVSSTLDVSSVITAISTNLAPYRWLFAGLFYLMLCGLIIAWLRPKVQV